MTARAGVSPTALYLHFADKQELLRAVCDEAFEELIAFLGRPPRARATTGARSSRRWVPRTSSSRASNRLSTACCSATHGSYGGGERPPEEDPGKRALGALVAVTARAAPEHADPLDVALQLWTGLHGFVSLQSVMPDIGQKMHWPADEEFLQGLVRAHLGS